MRSIDEIMLELSMAYGYHVSFYIIKGNYSTGGIGINAPELLGIIAGEQDLLGLKKKKGYVHISNEILKYRISKNKKRLIQAFNDLIYYNLIYVKMVEKKGEKLIYCKVNEPGLHLFLQQRREYRKDNPEDMDGNREILFEKFKEQYNKRVQNEELMIKDEAPSNFNKIDLTFKDNKGEAKNRDIDWSWWEDN